jgi:hypothetical protein
MQFWQKLSTLSDCAPIWIDYAVGCTRAPDAVLERGGVGWLHDGGTRVASLARLSTAGVAGAMVGLLAAAAACGQTYYPAKFEMAMDSWRFTPIVQMAEDAGADRVHSVLAWKASADGANGTIQAVWYLRDETSPCEWSAKTWEAATAVEAMNVVKTTLSIAAEYDADWPLTLGGAGTGQIGTELVYDKGFYLNDPFAEFVNGLPGGERDGLVDFLVDAGYSAADVPIEKKEGSESIDPAKMLNSMAALAEHIVWMQSGQTVTLPAPGPGQYPKLPLPRPTPGNPRPPVLPGQLPPGTTPPTAPAPSPPNCPPPPPNCIWIIGDPGAAYYTVCALNADSRRTPGGWVCLYDCTVCCQRELIQVCIGVTGGMFVNSVVVQTQCITDKDAVSTEVLSPATCPPTSAPPSSNPQRRGPLTVPGSTPPTSPPWLPPVSGL